MPASHPLIVPILVAERPGDAPSQDRVVTTANAVIVLDGASHPDPTLRDGGWLADQLGATLGHHIERTPTVDLADALAEAIDAVSAEHGLTPGEAPSTTVAIVRWTTSRVDVLVLCDSPVVVLDWRGQLHFVRDDRLALISGQLSRPSGFNADDPGLWRSFVASQQRQRNRAGGYWVAEATPEAARHAIQRTWPIDQVVSVLAMTDGVAGAIDSGHIPLDWSAAMTLGRDDPKRLVDIIHEAEAADPHGQHWPRAKRHDDKALAAIRFDLAKP